ncbi:MAG TPA: FadR/GntR family transcriptional regulator [Actinoallomurus sp.]|jgi:DNA-binding FadR family transcriptional regulator
MTRTPASTPGGKKGRPPRLPEVVAEHIQSDLLSRRLVAGDQLPTEAALAEQYDVSRTVVREAARLLEQRGLVDIRPGRGMVVAALDGAPIAAHYSLLLRTGSAAFEQLMEARFIVETDMTALAAERRTDEDLAEMHSALDAARRGSGDYEAFLQEDLRFHAAVARASHNLLLALFTDPVNACLRESYREPLAYLARQSTTLKEHEAILAAIEAQDAGAARAAAHAHLERVNTESTLLISGKESTAPPGR